MTITFNMNKNLCEKKRQKGRGQRPKMAKGTPNTASGCIPSRLWRDIAQSKCNTPFTRSSWLDELAIR